MSTQKKKNLVKPLSCWCLLLPPFLPTLGQWFETSCCGLPYRSVSDGWQRFTDKLYTVQMYLCVYNVCDAWNDVSQSHASHAMHTGVWMYIRRRNRALAAGSLLDSSSELYLLGERVPMHFVQCKSLLH